MSNNAIVIGAVVFLIVAIIVIRVVMRFAVNKTADAIHNAVVRKKEDENPTQPQSLADRYKADPPRSTEESETK